MKPLLNIRSVPISIEHKVTRASLQYDSSPPGVNVTRRRGGLNIQNTPAQVQIDTTEARASAGRKPVSRVTSDFAAAGNAAAREATRAYSEEGNRISDSKGQGTPIADIAAEKAVGSTSNESTITFMPATGPDISVQEGSLSFNFTMDKLTFDWNTHEKPYLEYVPGSIEFVIEQYPEIVIEYVGDPIYVPRSADPNYKAPPSIDVKG